MFMRRLETRIWH